eukprot:NODE_6726_length_1644_cov_8.420567.p1 GENE.NODE_6726_length_1644_cov_8.420567~~NODE_6726_length_1644_cov_8.420567.p1  ORF type:complete len:453 (-),score=125.29 NODE_6726_length_1644_cov_8.420567:284-1603(-)
MPADPFALMTRALDRAGPSVGGRRRVVRDLNNPADLEQLRAMHPDFDDFMMTRTVDYRTLCGNDTNFANRFQIPPTVDAARVFREHINSVDAVAWAPEAGQFVTASHDGTMRVWDASKAKSVRTMRGHKEGIFNVDVSEKAKLVISCGPGEEDNVLLWKWPQDKPCQALKGHHRAVHHATFSPDGLSAATTDQDGTIVLHDVQRAQATLSRNLHAGILHSSCFCRDTPTLLCTAGHDGTLQLIDLRDGGGRSAGSFMSSSMVANIVSLGPLLGTSQAHDRRAVYAAEFVDSHTIFSGGADFKMKRWDVRMLPGGTACAWEYLGHSANIRTLRVSQDMRFAVTGCVDGSSRVWDLNALQTAKAKKPQRSPTASVASATNAQKMLRDGHSGAALTLIGHLGLVSGVAWREGAAGSSTAHVLSSSWDQTARLYEVDLKSIAV